MSVRTVLVITGTALLAGVALAGPAHALTPAVPVDAYTLGPGRPTAIVAALTGLAGVAVGAAALARATGRGVTALSRLGPWAGRRGSVSAVAAGLIAVALGAVVVFTADGGLGTGNGLGGGIVAMAVGALATALGALALNRSRRRARAGMSGPA